MGKWVMVLVLAAACGGRNTGNSAPQSGSGDLDDGGAAGSVGVSRHDSGTPPDADTTSVELAGGTGGDGGNAGDGSLTAEAGSKSAAVGGGGATAAGGTAAPTGGAGDAQGGSGGAMESGGSSAPADRVLWSQSWTVAIHDASGSPGYDNATMGLALDCGYQCKFGFSGSPSGSTQTFPTDGACISDAVRTNTASGSAFIYDSAGMHGRGGGGTAPIAGWNEAIAGHTVKYLRRTQTYSIQLLGAGDTSWNYADFQGTWEAVGQ